MLANDTWIKPELWAPQFLEACRNGEEEKVLNLSTRSVSAVSDIGAKTFNEALNILEGAGKRDLAQRLVSKISRSECEHQGGHSCLAYKLINNRLYDFATRLIGYGLNPCISHEAHRGSLKSVVRDGNFQWVRRLIEEFNHPVNGYGILVTATLKQDIPIEMVQYLLTRGADSSEAADGGKISPIHGAILNNRMDLLQLLRDDGADMEALFSDPFGNWITPIKLAGKNEEMKQLLKGHPQKDCDPIATLTSAIDKL